MSESPDQRTRRRWISLAEFIAVAGLLIGAATFYFNWADRRADQASRAQEAANAGKARTLVTLTGAVQDGGESLALTDSAHTFSVATIRFPAALKIARQDAMPGPAIRARWFAAPLLAITDKGSDDREGRLPVLITVSWWDGDAKRTDTALYDILWRTEGRMLQGRKLVLTGLALGDRTSSTASLESAWARERPVR